MSMGRHCSVLLLGVTFMLAEAHPSYWNEKRGYCRAPALGDTIMGTPVEVGVTDSEVSLDGQALSISTGTSEHLLVASAGTFSNPSDGGQLLCDGTMIAWNSANASRSLIWSAPSNSTVILAIAGSYGAVTLYKLTAPSLDSTSVDVITETVTETATPTTTMTTATLASTLNNSSSTAPALDSTTVEVDTDTVTRTTTTLASTLYSSSSTVPGLDSTTAEVLTETDTRTTTMLDTTMATTTADTNGADTTPVMSTGFPLDSTIVGRETTVEFTADSPSFETTAHGSTMITTEVQSTSVVPSSAPTNNSVSTTADVGSTATTITFTITGNDNVLSGAPWISRVSSGSLLLWSLAFSVY